MKSLLWYKNCECCDVRKQVVVAPGIVIVVPQRKMIVLVLRIMVNVAPEIMNVFGHQDS